jgi:exodeoxyribonuclease III
MRIISWNVNGIRSVCKKGFWGWFGKADPDILCLQEIKAQENEFPGAGLFEKISHYLYINSGQKKGHAGVAIFTKEKPLKINKLLSHERFDSEGRFLELGFPKFSLITVYIPHGGRQKENLLYKLEVYDCLITYLSKLKAKNVILVGDFNIAHKEIDLARPKQNKNNIMFTSEERVQLDNLAELGFADTFRLFNKEGGNYTWWPYLKSARERNIGWRIDYCFASKRLVSKIKKSDILKEISCSDHCPIQIEL